MATGGENSATIRSSQSDEKSASLRSALNMGSETAFDFHCDLCIKDDKYLEAVGYCSNCKDYLCQECYDTHLRLRSCSHHVLLDQHRMPKATSQRQSKDMCTEPCAEHKNKTLKYHCAYHDQFGCSVCKTLHHRNCEGVDYIPDIAGDVLTSKEYKDMNLKMKGLINTARQAIKTTQQKTQTSNQQHSDASEFFKQLKKDLIAAVDRIETLTMTDAGKIRDENQEKIKYVEDQCNQLLKDIGALDSKFTSLENKGQHCQIFFSMKRSQDEIASLATSLLLLQDQSNITEYVVKMSDDLQNLTQQPKSMVSLEMIKNPQTSSTQSGVSVFQSKTQQNSVSRQTKPFTKLQPTAAVRKREKHKKSAAVHVADLDVRMENDRTYTDITGSVVLPGDKLVIVDNYNDKVKLINLQSNKIDAHLRYDGGVCDITAVTNTQVAVTCSYENTVLFINVTNTLTLDHKVKVKDKCRGIASISDKLVITYLDSIKVEIISQKGKLLQTVVTKDRGRHLFTYPHYVAVSPDRQTLYISDWNRRTVTSLNLRGQVKATYQHEKLKNPHGLTVDRDGVLYVCGSNTIHQLTHDLHKKQILLQESDGIKLAGSGSVSYDEKQNKLYIGMFSRSKIVKVYQLQ